MRKDNIRHNQIQIDDISHHQIQIESSVPDADRENPNPRVNELSVDSRVGIYRSASGTGDRLISLPILTGKS